MSHTDRKNSGFFATEVVPSGCYTDKTTQRNLAEDSKHAGKLAELRALAPKTFVALKPPREEPLPR